jgi:hypothetical protein
LLLDLIVFASSGQSTPGICKNQVDLQKKPVGTLELSGLVKKIPGQEKKNQVKEKKILGQPKKKPVGTLD